MRRLPPALAATATPRILELLGEPHRAAEGGPSTRPGAGGSSAGASSRPRVLELGFAGIHAAALRLAGFEVVVVEPDPAHRRAARERAGDALDAVPATRFDAVVAPADADLAGVEARRTILVDRDGAASMLE